MAIIGTKTDAHWQYFLSVEADLERLSRFIEFHEDNYSCYSIENVRILLAAAAEVEIVCKQICQALAPTSQPGTIKDYYKGIIKKCQDNPNVKKGVFAQRPKRGISE